MGSIQVGALALIYSAGIVNRYEFDWRGIEIGVANQWTHLNTAEGIEIAGHRIEYGLRNEALRNGADFSVFLNTASEFDGSDSGARPDEAISWGKIRKEAQPAKVGTDLLLNNFGHEV